MSKTFIVIPAFNEEQVISSVIKEIKSVGFRNIIIVDDGSSDNTFNKAKKEKIHVLRHVLNRGKGAAVITGISAALTLNADYIITMDGDGQHESKDLKRIEKVLKNNFDVVLGYRNLKVDKAPLIRIFSNYIANNLIHLLYGVKVKDSQSGLRGYSKKSLGKMEISSERYEFDSYIIRELGRHNLKFKEIPIKVYYTDYSKSKKEKQNLTNSIKTLYRIFNSL